MLSLKKKKIIVKRIKKKKRKISSYSNKSIHFQYFNNICIQLFILSDDITDFICRTKHIYMNIHTEHPSLTGNNL